jgi:hypothetical protein
MHRDGFLHVGNYFFKNGLLGIRKLKRQSLPKLGDQLAGIVQPHRALPGSTNIQLTQAEALCHKLLQRDTTLARMRTTEQGLELGTLRWGVKKFQGLIERGPILG